MRLSNHVSLAEFCHSDTAKRRGIDNTIKDPAHLAAAKLLCEKVFQPIREHFGVPIHISSGYRSAALNRAVKGSSSSQHCRGEAMDIDADRYGKVTNKEIFDYIREHLEWDQMIWEFGNDSQPDWVHVSFKATGNRRQILKAIKEGASTEYVKY
jgi:zinc D-Ala-D-Ala carboxypeptidase